MYPVKASAGLPRVPVNRCDDGCAAPAFRDGGTTCWTTLCGGIDAPRSRTSQPGCPDRRRHARVHSHPERRRHATGLHRREHTRAARSRGALRRATRRRQPSRLDAAAQPPSHPRRVAGRKSQRRVDRRAVPVLGLRHTDRRVSGPLPHAPGAYGGACGSHTLHAQARRARAGSRRHVGCDPGPAAPVQRLFRGWRRRGGSGLRELRNSRRLRGARATRDRRSRQDRTRALRRIMARHQAEGGGRSGRHRHAHLLRPPRRRILPGRCVSRRPLSHGARCPARLGRGHAPISRGSAHPRRRRHCRCRAVHRGGVPHDHEDPGAPHLLRRRQANPGGLGGSGRARVVAGGSAPHLSPRSRPRTGSHEGGVQLGPDARL